MVDSGKFLQGEDASKRFEFGRNWQDFIKNNLTQERIDKARLDLLTFIGINSLDGLTFLDIGSGSGIHSLGAYDAGARRVHSFDYDSHSVNATNSLRIRRGSPNNWQVQQGSILNGPYLSGLGQFDIVYSWGVLHHTGDVWTSLQNASQLVAPGGLLYVALYDADSCTATPEFWLALKQRYLVANWMTKRLMELQYVWRFMLGGSLREIPNLVTTILEYKKMRGMSFYTDVKDWLGGWPMQFTTVDEVIATLQLNGFTLRNIALGEANTEYLFAGPGITTGRDINVRNSLSTFTSPIRVAGVLRDQADIDKLRHSQPIYIYGTGKAGRKLFSLLEDSGISPAGFITSKDSGRCLGLSVMTIDEYSTGGKSDAATILICSKSVREISLTLTQYGIPRFWNALPFVLRSF